MEEFIITHIAHINAVTEELILYSIHADDLTQFQQLARTLPFPQITMNDRLLQINPFITTANIWLALKTHKSPVHKAFFFDEAKRMAYTPAIFQLEYIERSRALTTFINRAYVTDTTLVMLAYHLSYYMMDWVIRLMETADEAALVSYYLKEENFNQNITLQYEDEHQRKQRRRYMQALIYNVQHTDDVLKTIQHAIRDTILCTKVYNI